MSYSIDDEQRKHLGVIRRAYQQRSHKLEHQAAIQGTSTPPHVLIEIETLRQEIERIEAELKANTLDEPIDTAATSPSSARPASLPAQLTPLIGREEETRKVCALLRDPAVRLLTLTGTGGTGKTRLSLHAAAALLDEFMDGAWFVALAPLSDPNLVGSAIAQTLGVKDGGDQPLVDSLKSHLRNKQMLLLLDNFEQLLAAAPLVTTLLAAAPGLKVIVTSRVMLQLYGEQKFVVPPLALPTGRPLPPLDVLTQFEAVRLFIERAQTVNPDFCVTNENAPAVAEICARLDGLPLAIELAAARSKLFMPAALLTQLDSRFKLLTGGARDVTRRQQTMRNAIAWSYDLLDAGEKVLFARLGVFVGGSTLEAAEAVCDADGDLPIDLFAGMETMLDSSLLRRETGANGELRFMMLETIREYALECLAEHEDADVLNRRHNDYYLNWAERAEKEIWGAQQGAWLSAIECEHNNLRAALRWALEHGQTASAVQLASALRRFWIARGYLIEGRAWLSQALASDEAAAPAMRARAFNGLGAIAHLQGDYATSSQNHEKSLAIWQELDDQLGIATALSSIGLVAYARGDFEVARTHHQESLVLRRALKDQSGIATSLNNVGLVEYTAGDYAAAQSYFAESLAIRRALDQQSSIAISLHNLGLVARAQGNNEAALAHFKESLLIRWSLTDVGGIAASLEGFASVAVAQGQYEKAVRLFSAAEFVREKISNPRWIAERADYERDIETARAYLGAVEFAEAWAAGHGLKLEQAITETVASASSA
jgi:predicted ATPase/Tfp pilus assembly protein PilF